MSDEAAQRRESALAAFGASVKPGSVHDEAGSFEEAMAPAEEAVEPEAQADVETAVEATTEAESAPETEPAAEPETEETEAQRLVREASEKLLAQKPTQEPQPQVTSAELQAIKDQITQLGRAQPEVQEPEQGFDFSALEDPQVLALIQQAREDPAAEARMIGVIADKVFEARQSTEVAALKKELAEFKQALQQGVQRAQNQGAFQQGLAAAAQLGDVEAELVKDFQEKGEWQGWNDHVQRHGPDLSTYQPRTILGTFLAQHPEFMATPTLMQAGAKLLAAHLSGQGVSQSRQVSTTGAAARVKATSGADNEPDEELSEEDKIKQAIVAAETGINKIAAFRS